MRCAVFSNNRNKAMDKLNEIRKGKNISRIISGNKSVIYFF